MGVKKGLEDFIFLSSHLGKDYEITLVGLTDDQIKKVPKNIRSIKRTNGINELIQLYSNSDLYLNLSVEETMGLTTVEAMACGTPVIVYDATAVPEVVNDDVGRVVSVSNIQQLLTEILNFDFNLFKIEKLRQHASMFNNFDMIANYSDIYLK